MFFSRNKLIKFNLPVESCLGNDIKFDLLLHRDRNSYLFDSISPVSNSFRYKTDININNYYMFLPIFKFLILNNTVFTVNTFK